MKKSSNWYIGTVHFLVAGFAIPLVITLIAGLLVRYIGVAGVALQVIGLMVWLGGMVVGVSYSAQSLAKKYESYNKNKVIRCATMYHLLFPVFTTAIVLLFTTQSNFEINPAGVAVSFTSSAISAYIFYKLSHRLIREKTASQA